MLQKHERKTGNQKGFDMKVPYIYFPEKEKAAFAAEEQDMTLHGNEVLVKTDFDLLSAGTELANFHALPTTGTDFPKYPGYSLSSHVVHSCGHRGYVKKPEEALLKIPEGIDQKIAAWTHFSNFPMLGVRKLQIQLGEGVMVAGLGILGLFAIQYAKLSGGCPVIACDFSPERRELALKLGADYVLDPREPDFIQNVKDLTNGKGPEAVVEVTGYLSGLQQALQYVAFMGRISILGCTRISDEPLHIYRDIHVRGIQIIGAHTGARPAHDSYPGNWSELDDHLTFFRLVKAGRIQVDPIIHQIVSPKDAAEVYQTIGFQKDPPLGILFDWTKID